MSSFLHSPAWEAFQLATGTPVVRHQGQLYLLRTSHLFRYLTSSRLVLNESTTLPPFPAGTHFLRLEPENAASFETLQLLARQQRFQVVPTTSIQPRQTTLLDLHKTEEELLAAMHSKHRYNIRLAEKKGVTVQIYSENLQEMFPDFWRLLVDTAKRQGFRTHSPEYYSQLLKNLEPEGMAHLVFACLDNKPLATMILVTYGGIATYLHGGSSEEHKEYMAPYLLQWRAIQHAKALGCTTYDFWGTHAVFDDAENIWKPELGHASAGVTRLKLGFGGEVKEYPGAFDVILDPFWYSAYKALRTLRPQKRAFS